MRLKFNNQDNFIKNSSKNISKFPLELVNSLKYSQQLFETQRILAKKEVISSQVNNNTSQAYNNYTNPKQTTLKYSNKKNFSEKIEFSFSNMKNSQPNKFFNNHLFIDILSINKSEKSQPMIDDINNLDMHFQKYIKKQNESITTPKNSNQKKAIRISERDISDFNSSQEINLIKDIFFKNADNLKVAQKKELNNTYKCVGIISSESDNIEQSQTTELIKNEFNQKNDQYPKNKPRQNAENKKQKPLNLPLLQFSEGQKSEVKKPDLEPQVINENIGSGVFPGKNFIQMACWNVNGIRSAISKLNIHTILSEGNYDVICLNETRIDAETFKKKGLYHQLKSINSQYEQYYSFCSVKKGYSGVAIFSKEKAISVKQGIDATEFDIEGRVLTAEFDQFIIMTVYVPNNNQIKIGRTQYRNDFDKKFKEYILKLQNNHPDKPVIICGDINVAHQDIDIKYLRQSFGKPGITQMERNNFDSLLKSGWIDSFRYKNPTARKFTSGQKLYFPPFYFLEWRFDYFLINEKFIDQCLLSDIDSNTKGSDHKPIQFILRISHSKQIE